MLKLRRVKLGDQLVDGEFCQVDAGGTKRVGSSRNASDGVPYSAVLCLLFYVPCPLFPVPCPLIDDPPNPPAGAVAAGMRQRDFVVADDPIVEVEDVERAVRCDLQIDGAEPG